MNREHIPAPESSAQKLRKVKSKKGQLNSELDTGWTNGRIAGMIRNERYTGDVLVQKSYTADYLSHEVRKNKGEVQQYYIKDHHPAIVSRELFEKVQKIVNAKSDSHKREEKTQWAFSGRLICGSCGRFFNVRNGLNVQSSAYRDEDGNPTSTRKRSLKLTPELIAEAPDLLHFEKGIYCAFIEKETVKGDVVEFKTTFGVTLTTVGNRRTLNSFRGFKRCNMDGTVEYVDAPYKVYGFSIQYRRYLTMAAKRERKDAV